ncbi:Quinone oxidoreductase 1 [Corynebacterium capitovis DSM 44611]|uniref:quinone oxidoreductase family protein n=1 Tax=Corynebacterium capitovis TaxID=131081 RepID=UPI00037BBFD6|nr:quinone oxidoreductase [Corynebacterium capitovis]WKD57627.1 Quinone oxidoreductase 1 [Corynebacterium capitovis DSM 44611]
MKAILVTRHGGPDVLELADVPVPSPDPDHILVRVLYAGVNYIDTYFRSGSYPSSPPYIPGTEGCGQVLEDPSGDIAPGTLVAWHDAPGSYAEVVSVPRGRLVAVPDSVPPAIAASMLLQGMTAHYLLHGTRETRPGDTMVITAGAGGVGLILTQMATELGAVVFSVVSSEDKERLAYDAGAAHVFRYDANLAEQVRSATGGRGVDVVYDGVGKSTFAMALDVCRPRGLVCSFGSASGEVEPFQIQELNRHGSLFLTRPSLGAYVSTDDEFRFRAQAVVRAVESGSITVRVHEPYPLADASQAHQDLQSRSTSGSVVLKVN